MTTRYVFDTGALIGAERGDKRALQYIANVVAKAASVALAKLKRVDSAAVSIDAAVMAFAALTAAPVVTSDLDDLRRFQPIFPGVRLLSA